MTTIPDAFSIAPEPGAAEPDAPAAPWQTRFELLAMLLTAAVAVTVVARLLIAYDQAKVVQAFGDDTVDLLSVVRSAALSLGVWTAGALVVAFVLVTLVPIGRIGARGVLVLRLLVVLGLFLAGLAVFGAILVVAQDPSSSGVLADISSGALSGRASRIGWSAPLLMAAAMSVYVSWCAFSTLGELVPRPVIDDESGGSDAVVDAEEA